MVNQTNLYARQRHNISPDLKWTPVTVEEMPGSTCGLLCASDS